MSLFRRAGYPWRVAAGLLFAVAAVSPAPTSATDVTLAELGRKVYNFRCYFCHGYSGNAKTLAATYLTPPPADFSVADPQRLTVDAIAATLRQGRPGTAMKSFAKVIPETELTAVATFVHQEFVVRKATNTRYHTVENGWPDHERYREAFPFAKGEIPLSRQWEDLTDEQANGKRLYMQSCITCHDRGSPTPDPIQWEGRAVSYPRFNFSLDSPPLDAMSSASPYLKHEIPPKLNKPSAEVRRGERLFQKNCAFCHGASGTGKNWIGSFLEPHPRNLQDPTFMKGMSRERLSVAIAEGLPGTSMPAWKTVISRRDIRAIIAYIDKAFHPLPPWQISSE